MQMLYQFCHCAKDFKTDTSCSFIWCFHLVLSIKKAVLEIRILFRKKKKKKKKKKKETYLFGYPFYVDQWCVR